ncbi:MAG: molecular chaperone DnaJ [Candidatus Woesearchaeota archaeon]|jgi:molecular chaperone DnaJ|nr:molecular chaperone DnaJ [Candidatus Woesearchaeota archaeon]MDP7506041.1 molecular chaperone DnaJ [Candidatus Woesearchaeota archaeon]|tara:strand:- start:11046 stop:12140 length:1095 start_codon:yes stop_codon:yes gene_type:complete
MAKDYYNILGLEKDASKEDIKKAYKKLAKKYHPDINKEADAAEKFKEINEAASVLGDDQKKEQYDRFGTADRGQFGGGAGGFDFNDFGGFSSFDFGDIFDQFFSGGGGRRRRRGPMSGADLRYDMEIKLEEAAFGATKEIKVPRLEHCKKCGGTGAKSDSDIVTCHECDGNGVVRKTMRTPFGMIQQTGTCSKCQGEGKYVKENCEECDGTGLIKETRKIEVEIPKGTDNGTRLRMGSEGEAGEKGAPKGDLYIVLHVKEHDVFSREEDDINVDVPVSFVQAALGDEIEVPTLKGKAKLKVPAGTQTNTIFRMKSKGIPHINGYGTGSENVKVIVKVPEKVTKKQKQLLKDFEKESKKRKFKLF